MAAPIASSSAATVPAERQTAVQLQGSDADATPLTFAISTLPSHGTISQLIAATGALIYTPNAGYIGADSFQFTVESGGDTSAPGTVALAVTNARVRVTDQLTDPSGAPLSGKVTFMLTRPGAGPAGIVPEGASVSASLDAQGRFSVYLYPSRSMSPAGYYQAWWTDGNGRRDLLGIYDLPLVSGTASLSAYKVTDANLAARYSFVSDAVASALSNDAANARSAAVAAEAAAEAAELASTQNVRNVLFDNGQLDFGLEAFPDLWSWYDSKQTDLNDGAVVNPWSDVSGHGRHAARDGQNSLLRERGSNGLAYIEQGASAAFNMPLPAVEAKTVFIVGKQRADSPAGFALQFAAGADLVNADYAKRQWQSGVRGDNTPTAPSGYIDELSVIAWRDNGDGSASLFVNGSLVETFGRLAASVAAGIQNHCYVGPILGELAEVAVFPSAKSDADVARIARGLLRRNEQPYRYDSITTLARHFVVGQRVTTSTRRRPLVLLNHGAGLTERFWFDDPTYQPITRALMDAGYLVLAGSLGDNWGNANAISTNVDAYNLVLANYAVRTDRVAAMAFSMGALSTLLAFPDGRIPLKGAALCSPVCDLAHQYAANSAHATGIRAAYGIAPDGSDYALKTAGHDPILRAASNWAGKRLRFYVPTGDTVVSPSYNGEAFAAHVAGIAAEAGVVHTTGDHGSMEQASVADVLALFERCFY